MCSQYFHLKNAFYEFNASCRIPSTYQILYMLILSVKNGMEVHLLCSNGPNDTCSSLTFHGEKLLSTH